MDFIGKSNKSDKNYDWCVTFRGTIQDQKYRCQQNLLEFRDRSLIFFTAKDAIIFSEAKEFSAGITTAKKDKKGRVLLGKKQ